MAGGGLDQPLATTHSVLGIYGLVLKFANYKQNERAEFFQLNSTMCPERQIGSDSMLHKSINFRRGALRFVLAGCIFFTMPQQMLMSASSRQDVPPCYHKELGNIDFLSGDWIVEANVRSGDDKWEQSSATSQIKPDLSGCLLNERFTGSRGGHAFSALAIMGFNSVSGKLQRVWSDSEHGLLIMYEGNRNGREMILETEILLDGKRVKLRNAYLEITRDSFRLESGRSHDGGKTWITVTKLQYQRK